MKLKRPTYIDFGECIRQLFLEWLDFHPEDRSETVRDLKRIALEQSSRGLSFFTINLPEVDKYLCLSLDRHRLNPEGIPFTKGYRKGSVIPSFLKGFWKRIFDDCGHLLESADVNAIYYLRCILCIAKKYNIECTRERSIKAVQEYFDIESRLPVPSHIWDGETTQMAGLSANLADFGSSSDNRSPHLPGIWVDGDVDSLLHACQHIADRVVSRLNIEIKDVKPRHGPGVVSDNPEGKFKYNFPFWTPELEKEFPFADWGVHSYDSNLVNGIPVHGPQEAHAPSRLIAVPKTQKGPRLIAAEPTCNQWMQQGVANAIREWVKTDDWLRLTISFRDQGPSRSAALLGSTTGRTATLDLSSASDRLSCSVVERVFRRNLSLLRMLVATRTRFLSSHRLAKRLGSDSHARLIKLRKFASMGSALTFPVQSLVFAILAVGVGYHRLDGCFHPSGRRPAPTTERARIQTLFSQVRVYGDDIICPVDWVPDLVKVLTALGLKVNSSKSFFHGFFRESCGLDAFKGHDVTPIRIRPLSPALNSRASLGWVDTVNNLWLKGNWRLSSYLERTAPWSRKIPVVSARSRVVGWTSFCSGLSPDLRKKVRWDHNLQCEVVEVPRLISPENSRTHVESWNGLTAWFSKPEPTAKPLPHIPEDVHYVPVSSVAGMHSRTPALIRRSRVPLHLLEEV